MPLTKEQCKYRKKRDKVFNGQISVRATEAQEIRANTVAVKLNTDVPTLVRAVFDTMSVEDFKRCLARQQQLIESKKPQTLNEQAFKTILNSVKDLLIEDYNSQSLVIPNLISEYLTDVLKKHKPSIDIKRELEALTRDYPQMYADIMDILDPYVASFIRI